MQYKSTHSWIATPVPAPGEIDLILGWRALLK
jgi:hypothetical protein